MKLDRQQLQSYLGRDWKALTRLKDEHWQRRKERLGLEEALRVMDDLRNQAKLINPEWPTDEDRAKDLEAHLRLSDILRRCPPLERDEGPRRAGKRRR